MRKTVKKEERWYTAREAVAKLAENAKRPIPASYIRALAKANKVETKPLDGRTVLYRASDVDGYTVQKRGAGKKADEVEPEPAIAC
jgi:hypothetical protein